MADVDWTTTSAQIAILSDKQATDVDIEAGTAGSADIIASDKATGVNAKVSFTSTGTP